MWPDTRRVRATPAKAYVRAAVVEALEPRRLLTAVAADDAPLPTQWDLVGDQGEQRGTVTLVDGILHVVTTSGDETIQLGTSGGNIYVAAFRNSGSSLNYANIQSAVIDRARVHGIQVDAGDGNDTTDYLNYGGLINLPTTLNGDAGDDDLTGEHDRDNADHKIAFQDQQSSYANVVLNGGEGNDRLEARIGDTTLMGGAGDDRFVVGDPSSSWGTNAIVDDQFAPTPASEHVAPPHQVAPPEHVAPPAHVPAPAKPAPSPAARPADRNIPAAPPMAFSVQPLTHPARASNDLWDDARD